MRLLICACIVAVVGSKTLTGEKEKLFGVRHSLQSQEVGRDVMTLSPRSRRLHRNVSSLNQEKLRFVDEHLTMLRPLDASTTSRQKRRRIRLSPEERRLRKLRKQARAEQVELMTRRHKKRHQGKKNKVGKVRRRLQLLETTTVTSHVHPVKDEKKFRQTNQIPIINLHESEERIPENYYQHLAERNRKMGKQSGEEEDEDNVIPTESKGVATSSQVEDNNVVQQNSCAAANCDQVCSEVQGRPVCSCHRGFRLRGNKCWDVNECARRNGGCEQGCHNTQGSYHCVCKSGFRLEEDAATCRDVNECLLRNGHGPCQDTCRNTWSGYVCTCDGLPGTRLAKGGHTCEDLDECSRADNGGCSHTCLNTLGTAFCLCPAGFRLAEDYKTCLDIDECSDQTGQHGQCPERCVNTPGSYRCLAYCPSGYTSDENGECNDRDECDELNECSQRCINTPGSFMCLAFCPLGYKSDESGECYDRDECEENNDCTQHCINTRGSYHCACHLGYVLLDDKNTCQEVRQHAVCPPLDTPPHGYLECSRLTLRASDWRYRVVNHSGSYCELRCPKSYTLDGVYRRFCGQSGRWLGPNYGVCKKVSLNK